MDPCKFQGYKSETFNKIIEQNCGYFQKNGKKFWKLDKFEHRKVF